MDKPIYYGKKYKFLGVMIALLLSFSIQASQAPTLINVNIGLMESLSPSAPSASDRYKRLYESAFYYALGENEQKLQKCGYKITPQLVYFDTFDALDLIANAKKINESKAWVVVGPRRSSHLKIAESVLTDTPIVSTMANSDAIHQNSQLSFSMYPYVSILSKLMAKEVMAKNYGRSYGVVVDARCQSCVDFARKFRNDNTKDKQLFYLEVGDNTPDIKQLHNDIKKFKIDYLVTPNYSELTGYIISEIQKSNTELKYVGSDGWGEDSFSFLQGYKIHDETIGISIRVGLRKEDKSKYYKVYSLDREINGSIVTPPYSIYSLVSLVRVLTDDLCHSKAKSSEEFKAYLAKQPLAHFQSDSLYSIYKFDKGQLVFSNYVETQ